MELWKYIEGQEERYAVSSEGRVKSFYSCKKKKRGVPLIKKPGDARGYLKVRLGENKSFSIHRLVALAFNANPENKCEVDHIDGNRTNNRSTNLRWANSSEQGRNKVCNSNTGWPGVNWVERSQSYQARISLPIKDGEKCGKKISKSYSVKKYGAEAAIKLAIKWRDEKEKEIDPVFYGPGRRNLLSISLSLRRLKATHQENCT